MWSIWTIIKYLKVVINVKSKRKLFVLQHWRNWENREQLSLQVEIWCLNFSIFDRNTSVKRFPSQSLVDVWDESIDEKKVPTSNTDDLVLRENVSCKTPLTAQFGNRTIGNIWNISIVEHRDWRQLHLNDYAKDVTLHLDILVFWPFSPKCLHLCFSKHALGPFASTQAVYFPIVKKLHQHWGNYIHSSCGGGSDIGSRWGVGMWGCGGVEVGGGVAAAHGECEEFACTLEIFGEKSFQDLISCNSNVSIWVGIITVETNWIKIRLRSVTNTF